MDSLTKKIRQWYWMPITVLVLGTLSIAMLLWEKKINERERMNVALVDAVVDAHLEAATFHFRFEEAISGQLASNVEKTWGYLEKALGLIEIILNGGESKNGIIVEPLKDSNLRTRAEELRSLLIKLRGMGNERFQNWKVKSIGSILDEPFDAVFMEFEEKAFSLDAILEKELIDQQGKSRRLFLVFLFFWMSIVMTATIGIWTREIRRRASESALQKTNERLQLQTEELEKHRARLNELVEERTAELTIAHRALQQEIMEKMTLQKETMRAAHLASIGELAAGVAHEINNPINGIINYAQILIDEGNRGNGEREIPNRIIKEGDRIAAIVRSLLSFAKERKGEKVPVDIREILSETLVLSETLLRKDGIILKVDMPVDLPRITAHFQQIQQVFLNLLNNARHALNQKYPGDDKNKTLEIAGEAPMTQGGRQL